MKKTITMQMQGILVQVEGNQAEPDEVLAKACCALGDATFKEIAERQRIEQLAERMAVPPQGLRAVPPLT